LETLIDVFKEILGILGFLSIMRRGGAGIKLKARKYSVHGRPSNSYSHM